MQATLTTEYHQQELSYYCGAACAQMIMSQPEVGVPHTVNTCEDNPVPHDCTNNTDLCQRCLYEESHTPIPRYPGDPGEPGWFSYPDSLNSTLNRLRPPAFAARFRFVLFEYDVTVDPTAASLVTHRICWTIKHYKVAPIAMVLESKHWIAVTGYEAPNDPSSSTDPVFDVNTISNFWIHDPFPAAPSESAQPPHWTGDDCGKGIVNGEDRGAAYQQISRNDWWGRYMMPVDFGNWKNKYLAICDPENGPEKGREIRKEKKIKPGKKLIGAANAASLAMKVLYLPGGLLEKDFLPKQLKKVKPADPILVKCIDREKDYYYIVPLQGTDKKIYGTINIDALYGYYKQSAFAKKNGHLRKYRLLSKKKVLSLLGKEIDFNGKKVRVFSKTVQISSVFVWMPCKESLSPNYPFQVVTIGNLVLYIRIDGKVFTKLSKEGSGM